MNADPRGLTAEAAFGVARSFSGRRWQLQVVDDVVAQALARDIGISPVLARLLTARGITASEALDHLNPTLRRFLPDPSVLKNMDKAVARAANAVMSGDAIAIWGDYDVDGSTSAALLHEFLSVLGPSPRIYIPDRLTEGYGPNSAGLQRLKDEGATLVITVDCGAGAVGPLTAARDAGLDVIVLDHHAVETAPPAVAHVNPNQPGDTSGLGHVCAAGVTFLFVVALNRALRPWYAQHGIAEPALLDYADFVGLATICDVVPLHGVNRAFVRAGLTKLGKLDRQGFAALAAIASATGPFTPYHAGFLFGPRINAGGRVGRSSLGVELLTARDPALAKQHALQLDLHNSERQAIEKTILEEATAMAAMQDNAPFLLVANEGWHPGVVGIVAGRLKDRFQKPAFVAGFEGGLGRGSARSMPGMDIGEMVRAARDANLIESGGGHAMAAGFGLSPNQLEPFRRFLAARVAEADVSAIPVLAIDDAISPCAATTNLIDEIAKAGPFGAGNEEPLVVLPHVEVVFADTVGKDHIKLRLAGGDGSRLDAIAFRAVGTALGAGLMGARGQTIHIVGRLRADEWQGNRRVQLQVEDAAPATA